MSDQLSQLGAISLDKRLERMEKSIDTLTEKLDNIRFAQGRNQGISNPERWANWGATVAAASAIVWKILHG